MFYYLLLFCKLKNITVYQRTSSYEPLYNFEREFVKKVVELYNSKTEDETVQYSFQFST